MKNKISLFYIPCPSKASANQLAKILVTNKLAACANIYPIDSIYSWNGKIESSKETVLILKTLPNLSKNLNKEVSKIHPYETPCILQQEVSVNRVYRDWMKLTLQKN